MKTLKILLLVVISVATYWGCKKADDDPKENIHTIIPDTTLTKIKALGMPINEGTTPPLLNNTYVASPFKLKASNIIGDFAIGYQFADYIIKFYEQNTSNLTLKVNYNNGPETGIGLGSVISGTDSSFTVVAKVMSHHNNADSASAVQIISGKLGSNAIKALHVAFFMIDNYGNTSGYWMANGQGRIIYDSDANSPIVIYGKSYSEEKEGGYLKAPLAK